jgi:hypothetical protein
MTANVLGLFAIAHALLGESILKEKPPVEFDWRLAGRTSASS